MKDRYTQFAVFVDIWVKQWPREAELGRAHGVVLRNFEFSLVEPKNVSNTADEDAALELASSELTFK
jgi:hypothetical protein